MKPHKLLAVWAAIAPVAFTATMQLKEQRDLRLCMFALIMVTMIVILDYMLKERSQGR